MLCSMRVTAVESEEIVKNADLQGLKPVFSFSNLIIALKIFSVLNI